MTTRRRTLPPVSPRLDAELRPLVAAIAEIIETGEGVRGDPLDRKITMRDLLDSGIAELKAGARASGGAGSLQPGVTPEPPDRSTPPPPAGFAAAGSFDGRILLTWDIPQSLYDNHAYTNIYRSADDNFANAVIVGRDVGVVFTDYARDDAVSPDDPTHLQGYYYWITFTSASDVEGPPNASAGTYAEPLPDVGYLLETLTGNLDDAPATLGAPDETLILHAERFAVRTGPADSPVYPLVIADVGGVPTVVLDTAIIRDASIQEGQLGPISIGKIEQNDGTPITTVSGLIRAEAIDADNLSVLEAATFYSDVYSGNYVAGSTGWKILQDGTVEFNEGTFNGVVEFQNVTGAGALASQDTVDYGTEVTGTKPPADADKTDYTDDRISNAGLRDEMTGTNHALGATFTGSDTITNASYLNDGIKALSGNYWSLPADAQWIEADLGVFKFIAENRVYFYNLDGRTYQYALAVSETGSGDWVFVVGSGDSAGNVATYATSRDGGDGKDGDIMPTIDAVGRHARYVRLYMNGSTANTGNHGHEWEILGVAQGVGDPYWIRPGTTRIDGNKIYTGDAYVDTLQIKGQAVTIPVSAYSGSTYTIPSGDSTWYQVLSAYINVEAGVPVIVTASFVGFSDNAVVVMRVNRGGTALRTIVAESADNYNINSTIYDVPGGPATYRLYVKHNQWYSHMVRGQIYARTLVLLGTKR